MAAVDRRDRSIPIQEIENNHNCLFQTLKKSGWCRSKSFHNSCTLYSPPINIVLGSYRIICAGTAVRVLDGARARVG